MRANVGHQGEGDSGECCDSAQRAAHSIPPTAPTLLKFTSPSPSRCRLLKIAHFPPLKLFGAETTPFERGPFHHHGGPSCCEPTLQTATGEGDNAYLLLKAAGLSTREEVQRATIDLQVKILMGVRG